MQKYDRGIIHLENVTKKTVSLYENLKLYRRIIRFYYFFQKKKKNKILISKDFQNFEFFKNDDFFPNMRLNLSILYLL